MLDPQPTPSPLGQQAVDSPAPPSPPSQASLDFWSGYAAGLPSGDALRSALEQALATSSTGSQATVAVTADAPPRDDDRGEARSDDAEALLAAQQSLDAHLATLTPALQLAKST